MRIDFLRDVEKSAFFKKIKLFLKILFKKEIRLRLDTNCRTMELGGWVICPAIVSGDGGLVYSLGVENDTRFDSDLIKMFSMEVHAFDPSPSTVEWIKSIEVPAKLKYHPWAVSDTDGDMVLFPREKKDGTKSKTMYSLLPTDSNKDYGVRVPVFTLSTILTKLGHERGRLEILKIDVEGAEYGIIEDMINNGIRPLQLLVEFHHRFPGIGKEKTEEAIRLLRLSGYLLFSVSITGRELSFIHSSARTMDGLQYTIERNAVGNCR